jgi:nucleotide-binding universal stress UspA family protein
MSQLFAKILCPIDLSSFSLDALKLAVKLAVSEDAVLDILHVIQNPFDEIYMSAITQTDPALLDAYAAESQQRAKIVRATEDHSKVLLKQFCHDVVQSHDKVRYHVRGGDPFETILGATEDLMTDLVILATHGRTGVKRLVIGNVAEKIVRHAPCPVLTVKNKPAG